MVCPLLFPYYSPVLDRLGFNGKGLNNGQTIPHYNHFHVDLRAPLRVGLPDKLVTDIVDTTAIPSATTLTLDDLPASYRELVIQAQTELQPQQGAFDMFVDLPPDSPNQPPIVMVADATQTKRPIGVMRTLGVCAPMENVPNDPVLGKMTIALAGAAANYLFDYEKRNVSERDAKVALLQAPAHGRLIAGDTYVPDQGFHGQDKIVALVELGGYQVKVVYFIKVVNEDQRVGDDEASIKKYCPRTDWKISLPQTPLDLASIDSLVSYTGIGNTINIDMGGLVSGAVGSTTGSAITLDDNAAGYNWFIDATPADNSEFLPTANSNEWVAKEGSEAAGKMDMLSVLLHEYGHALGLEHSANSQDFMATTLTPGVRRLPSAEELTLMAQLVGEIKGDMTAGSNTPDAPKEVPLGDTPQSPLPSIPLGGAFGLALLGRLRNTRYGWNIAVDSATQYEVAANSTFTNSQLQSADGWSTTGNVAIGNGAAVLSETATSQTRLNQVFVVGEHDRFLSFTLANLALDDAANAPDDAFEAALLDANTGLSLLGGTGLTHNDAFLNLQADGSEHAASGITSIRNADGSRTYLVDLAGIPAGTAVNLSFDLLGFGQGAAATNSHLTIRDLRIGVPQTTDDSATLAEDTPTTIAALTNDLNSRQPGFVPVVVDAPAHGQVTINADGSFNFAPDKDWNGEDRFTYKLSDGHVDSNLATVSLTVTPVNDAPVTANDAASVQEDGTLVVSGNLLANDSDVDASIIGIGQFSRRLGAASPQERIAKTT